MECEEIRVDLRTIPHSADRQRSAQLLFRLNHTLPFSEEYNALLRELLGKNLGEGSTIAPPLSGAALDMLKIGRGVFVNSNLLAMARGGITIGDHARIAANVQLLSNNHDPYDLDVLTCKPVDCRSLYSGVLVMAGRAQLGVWIFCVCYRQMKACAVIGIQLLLLAFELVALHCIACNAGR